MESGRLFHFCSRRCVENDCSANPELSEVMDQFHSWFKVECESILPYHLRASLNSHDYVVNTLHEVRSISHSLSLD